MRTIKFRAWNKKKKVMIEGSLEYWFRVIAETGLNPYKECEWLEFTGLKDKNNVCVYEGDILKTTSENSSHTLLAGTYTVEYFSGGFKLVNDSFGEKIYHDSGSYPNGNTEIIGNIYENPKLMNDIRNY